MPIKPPSPRHLIQQLDSGIQIILPSKKNYFRIAWYGLWLIMWVFMTGTVITIVTGMVMSASGLFGESNSGMWIFVGFLTVMLLFLLGMGLPVVYSFFWQLAGREIISIKDSVLSVARQIFGWKKVYDYGILEIKDLRASIPQRVFFAPARIFQHISWQNGIIAFDYGAKTFRFGLEIDEAEAKQIVFKLQEHLEKHKTG